MFGGVGIAPAVRTSNLHLDHGDFEPAFSPNFELGLRYMHHFGKGVHGSAAVGLGYTILRGRFEAYDGVLQPGIRRVYQSMPFAAAILFSRFLEAGILYNSTLLNDEISIFTGYRLTHLGQAGFGYGESDAQTGRFFSADVEVNPDNMYLHGVVFRPEYIFISNKTQSRTFSIALQMYATLTPDNKEFFRGTYDYSDSDGNAASGSIGGGLMHLTLVGQYYL